MDITVADLRKDTIQILPDAKKDTGVEIFGFTQRGYYLEGYATRGRENQLRAVSRNEFLWMTQGAFAGIGKLTASTSWQIKGPEKVSDNVKSYYRERAKAAQFNLPGKQREDIEYYQQLVRLADFLRGWASFCKKTSLDYLRQDGGCYIEVIAPGNPSKAPTGPPTGIAYLDSLKCIPTGDPEYPVYYYDKKGKLHICHHTRVHQLLDMPDGDERYPGYGLCALSRVISIANREVLMGRYIESSLDDKPRPGIMVAQGMKKENRDRMLAAYNEDQARDVMPPWGKTMWVYGMDTDTPVTLTPVEFSVAPEKFDFKTYTELDINAMALAIGVDVQELWQLTSAGLGSGAQSEILQQKSRGKLIGDWLTNLERLINDILPEDYQFEFKQRDAQEEIEAAQNAQAWASAVASMASTLSMDEQRVLLANTIDQYREAVTDEKGKIQRRDDLDVQPGYDIGSITDNGTGESVATDTTAMPPQQKQVSTNDVKKPNEPTPTSVKPTDKPANPQSGSVIAPKPSGSPDITAIQNLLNAGVITLDQAQRLAGVPVDTALSGLYLVERIPVPRERVGDLWESRFGRGVAGFEAVVNATSPAPLAAPASAESKPTEAKAYQSTLLDFEGNFEDLVASALKGDTSRGRFAIVSRAMLKKYGRLSMLDGLKDGGIETDDLDNDDMATFSVWMANTSSYLSDFADRIYKTDTSMTPSARAEAWGGKSLRDIYQKGLISADANSLREWTLGSTEQHCPTCLRLNGQRHRLKDWAARGLLPGSDLLDCNGYNCDCKLAKTKGRGKGKY